jgi:hypothetical protein
LTTLDQTVAKGVDFSIWLGLFVPAIGNTKALADFVKEDYAS